MGPFPDATRVTILKVSSGEINKLSSKLHVDNKIAVEHWNNLHGLDWTADGKGLFTSSFQPSAVLLSGRSPWPRKHPIGTKGHENALGRTIPRWPLRRRAGLCPEQQCCG